MPWVQSTSPCNAANSSRWWDLPVRRRPCSTCWPASHGQPPATSRSRRPLPACPTHRYRVSGRRLAAMAQRARQRGLRAGAPASTRSKPHAASTMRSTSWAARFRVPIRRNCRAACASALHRAHVVLQPRLILLDEPFGALDAQTRLLMGDELLRLWRETHATVLLITHALDRLRCSPTASVMSARPGVLSTWSSHWPRDRDSRVVSDPASAPSRRDCGRSCG